MKRSWFTHRSRNAGDAGGVATAAPSSSGRHRRGDAVRRLAAAGGTRRRRSEPTAGASCALGREPDIAGPGDRWSRRAVADPRELSAVRRRVRRVRVLLLRDRELVHQRRRARLRRQVDRAAGGHDRGVHVADGGRAADRSIRSSAATSSSSGSTCPVVPTARPTGRSATTRSIRNGDVYIGVSAQVVGVNVLQAGRPGPVRHAGPSRVTATRTTSSPRRARPSGRRRQR